MQQVAKQVRQQEEQPRVTWLCEGCERFLGKIGTDGLHIKAREGLIIVRGGDVWMLCTRCKTLSQYIPTPVSEEK